MRFILCALCLCCISFVLSCKTSKKLVETVEEEPIETSDLFIAYSENQLIFDQVEFSANMEFDSGDMKLGFSSIFRIKDQEKIWASFKKFGFEAARLLITPDSIFVVNRLQSSYIAEDLNALKTKAGVPVEFEDLQQMLLGGSFWESNLIELNDSTLYKTEKVKDDVVEVKHFFDTRKFVRQSIVSAQNQGELTLDYDNYSKVENASLAFDRSFLVKRKEMNVILTFETLKIDTNSAKSFPFEIPANYTRQPF